MAALRAQIAGIDVQIDKSQVRAPFDARVGTRLADPGQAIAAGQPVLRLFDAAPARLRVGVPPHLARSLPPGSEVRVQIGERTVTARVLQLRPDLDPVTRSRAVIVALPDGIDPALGETATLILPESRVPNPASGRPSPPSRKARAAAGPSWRWRPAPTATPSSPRRSRSSTSPNARVFLRGALPPGNRIVGEAPTAWRRASWSSSSRRGVMAMDTLFFRNPRVSILALLVIVAAGLSALVSIGRQEDPTITNIFATVTTVFPGRRPRPRRSARDHEDRGGTAVDPRDRRDRLHLRHRHLGRLGGTR